MKTSEAFEGENSSMKRTFDEACSKTFIEEQQDKAREIMSANMVAFEMVTHPADRPEKRAEEVHANLDTLIAQIIQATLAKVNEANGEKKEVDNFKFIGTQIDQIGVQRDMGHNAHHATIKEALLELGLIE